MNEIESLQQKVAFGKEVVQAMEFAKSIASSLQSALACISEREAAEAMLRSTLPMQRGLEQSISRLLEAVRQ